MIYEKCPAWNIPTVGRAARLMSRHRSSLGDGNHATLPTLGGIVRGLLGASASPRRGALFLIDPVQEARQTAGVAHCKSAHVRSDP